MKAITLRNLPPEVAKAVRKEAERKRTSVNRAVIGMLGHRMERHKKKQRKLTQYDDLESLAGSWTKSEAAEFAKTLAAQRSIDPELWK